MSKKKPHHGEDAKLKSAIDHSKNSQNSSTGYLEQGNPAVVHAKARAMRHNDNGSHI
jgi:hypothetical protein